MSWSPPRGHDDTYSLAQIQMEAAKNESLGLPVGQYARYMLTGELQGLTATREQLQDQGGFTILPTVAGQVTLVSTSVLDSAGGTGTQFVLVRGLNADFESGDREKLWLDEVVPMDGTNPVQTLNSFVRVMQIQSVGAGTSMVNAGNIDASIGGNLQLRIAYDTVTLIGNGVSKSMSFTVPNGWTAYAGSIVVTWSGNQPAHLWFSVQLGTAKVFPVAQKVEGSVNVDLGVIGAPSFTDVTVEAVLTGGAGGFPINAHVPVALIRT